MLCTLVKCLSIPTEGIGWGNSHTLVWTGSKPGQAPALWLVHTQGYCLLVVSLASCCAVHGAWDCIAKISGPWALLVEWKAGRSAVCAGYLLQGRHQPCQKILFPHLSIALAAEGWTTSPEVVWHPGNAAFPVVCAQAGTAASPQSAGGQFLICAHSGFCLNSVCLDANVGQIIVRAAS